MDVENIKEKESQPIHHNALDEKKKLLSKSELSIWLDSYDAIFSDFDSRSFSERTLSDDFIIEAKKMAKEKSTGAIELKLLMPAQHRQKNTEEIIVKSLHMHFRRFAHLLEQEMKQARKKGLLLSLLGFSIMSCAVYLAGISEKNFLINASRVIMEPAGWFFVWTGFENIFYVSRKKKPEFNFMDRMAHAEIKFLSF